MKRTSTRTLEECESIRAALRAHFGFPMRGQRPDGTPVGPETYYPGAPGWTADWCDVIEVDGGYALPVDPVMEDLAAQGVIALGEVMDVEPEPEPEG